jgi:nitrate reductase cytochrome c-type subunit
MPMKFKESSTNTKTGKTTHYYMHTTPVQELKDALDNDNTPPKLKHKVRNYLLKKGLA